MAKRNLSIEPGSILSLCMHLSYQEHTIHYERFGNGPELLFCLHGYGESGTGFAALGEALRDNFTLLCPDLPLHGQTKWLSETFSSADLFNLLSLIAIKEGFNGKHFHLAGYSMGGRLAMELTEKSTGSIISLILLAPDGLKINFWYWLATQTLAGNWLFRYNMFHSAWFLNLLQFARKSKLLNESIYKFSTSYLTNEKQRINLYKRWTLFRHFKPDLRELKKQILRHKIKTTLIFGELDRIIPPALGKRLAGNNSNVTIITLDTGHRLLKSAIAITIAEKLKPAGKSTVSFS